MSLIFYFIIAIYLFGFLLISQNALHMLQENRYNRGWRYIKWIKRNFANIFLKDNLLWFILFIPIIFNIPSLNVILFLVLLIYFILKVILKPKNSKLALKYTARIKRIIFTYLILNVLIIILIILSFNKDYLNYYCLILSMGIYFNYLIVLLANFLNRPLEKAVGIYYQNLAKKKLNDLKPNLKVIGITGSYGKTTTKNVVYEILNIKFNAFKTPENYNTPYGLMISINNYLDKYNDYFIAEMGACKKGDIDELCRLVRPNIGILTKIGLAHLETFGSVDNILKTKFELIENLPQDGLAILNKDDLKQVNYPIKNKCEKLWIGIDNHDADFYAYDIVLNSTGTKFNVYFKTENKAYPFATKLLGKANLYNILEGIALGYKLGISIKDLQKAVERIKPVLHRLSISKYYDIFIIDDAYNSNPEGAKMALETLNLMPGKKIVVTPGMIEIGDLEDEVNREFGEQIAAVADEVILIGKEKTYSIYEGLMASKYSKKHIHILNDVMDAFPLMQKLKGDKETYVLLENDLPDTFNEE